MDFAVGLPAYLCVVGSNTASRKVVAGHKGPMSYVIAPMGDDTAEMFCV